MVNENFGTIRAAVSEFADSKAEKDLLDKPAEKHYKEAFKEFRTLKNFDEDTANEFIYFWANQRELINKVGEERNKIYDTVYAEKQLPIQEDIDHHVKEIFDQEKVSQDQKILELSSFLYKISTKLTHEVSEDPRVVKAFNGEEGYLRDMNDFVKEQVAPMIIRMLMVA